MMIVYLINNLGVTTRGPIHHTATVWFVSPSECAWMVPGTFNDEGKSV